MKLHSWKKMTIQEQHGKNSRKPLMMRQISMKVKPQHRNRLMQPRQLCRQQWTSLKKLQPDQIQNPNRRLTTIKTKAKIQADHPAVEARKEPLLQKQGMRHQSACLQVWAPLHWSLYLPAHSVSWEKEKGHNQKQNSIKRSSFIPRKMTKVHLPGPGKIRKEKVPFFKKKI